ncbi:adenine DNA glycosylase isoform X2 [Numida meleagris]|uniref:adenine DNA glycosylase isoform X2 n=1 Tax=Numida meleagris TaxID=8996 RepID=UPI000B3DC4EE|nr:adenine DNA glycosylase isoform X2 [Numida meleagris]
MSRLRAAAARGLRRQQRRGSSSAAPTGRGSRKGASPREEAPARPPALHLFRDPVEIDALRSRLLAWYDKSRRDLPWRTLAATEPDADRRAYAEVANAAGAGSSITGGEERGTGLPSLLSLCPLTLCLVGQEVNELWAGLGYYSRGKRLQEAARKVVSELGGRMPRTAEDLQKLLPGVGRYTAGAIASISFGQATGVVDGNVIRVLCRLRCIGADTSSLAVTDCLWDMANALVDRSHPGDFNQALMELGATVCTPKSPLCGECPVKEHCHSWHRVEKELASASQKLFGKSNPVPDVEDCGVGGCPLCPPAAEPWDSSLGVTNFPRKAAKKQPRAERTATCVLERRGHLGVPEYLIVQRPSSGLLAGLWEFPSLPLAPGLQEEQQKEVLADHLRAWTGRPVQAQSLSFIGEVVHIFSHIHQTYAVYSLCLDGDVVLDTALSPSRWVSEEEFRASAVSTAMKKVLKARETQRGEQSGHAKVGGAAVCAELPRAVLEPPRTWGCTGSSPSWSRETCLAGSVCGSLSIRDTPLLMPQRGSLRTLGVWFSPGISPAGLQAEAGIKAGGGGQHPHRDAALPARLPPSSDPSVMAPLAADTSRSCAVVSPAQGSCRSPRGPVASAVPSSSPTAIRTSPLSPVHLWMCAVQGAGAVLDVTRSWAHSPALGTGLLGLAAGFLWQQEG